MRKIKQPVLKILITVFYLSVAAVFYFSDISCIFLEIFGIRCVGCGMTRALISALKFDFWGAFGYHFMFWSVPILYLYFLYDGVLFKNKTVNRAVFIVIAVSFLANWIIKL